MSTDALLADLQTTLHANSANLNDGDDTWATDGQQHVTSQSYQYQHGDIDQQVRREIFLPLISNVANRFCKMNKTVDMWMKRLPSKKAVSRFQFLTIFGRDASYTPDH